jgi:hypothetical protein
MKYGFQKDMEMFIRKYGIRFSSIRKYGNAEVYGNTESVLSYIAEAVQMLAAPLCFEA